MRGSQKDPKPTFHHTSRVVNSCDCRRETELVWGYGAVRRYICIDCAMALGADVPDTLNQLSN